MIYTNFASVYDRLMQDVPYGEWIVYLGKLMQIHHIEATNILDIGCGTGNVTLPLAEMGYKLTGLDLSAEMLAVAEAKARAKGLHINWTQQDMTVMDLGGQQYDMVISMTDSLNYLNTNEQLKKVFKLVHKALMPGGWFVFDLNSYYKVSKVFGDNTFTLLDDDVAYVWDNAYDPVTRTCLMDLTFFVRDADGRYRRFEEQHAETGYPEAEVQEMLEGSGYCVKAIYAENSFDAPSKSTERIYFVAQSL